MLVYLPACYKRDIVSWKRSSHRTACFPHTAFCPISPYGISEFFPRYKSNTTFSVVLSFGA